MTVETSHGLLPCGSCGSAIPAGQPIYFVTAARLPRCASCAAKIGPLPTIVIATDVKTPDFQRFDPGTTASKVRRSILDAREQQIGARILGEKE